jgi:chromosome segregation ATPase
MTAENHALLQAIRAVVREEVTPLSGRIDGLAGRFDGLTEQVGVLTERVDGLTEQVGGLTERMDVFTERVDGLTERTDVLTERVDGLTGRTDGLSARVDRIETEQRLQRGLLHSIEESIDERFTHLDLRLTNLEAISMRLETEIETIETRTGQIFSDVTDLLELQEKVNVGFHSFKDDLQRAFVDIGAVQGMQQSYQRQMKQLRERVDRLEHRVSKLEGAGGAHE